MIGRRRAVIGWATLGTVVALWFGLTTWTGIVSAGRFPSPADFWFSLIQRLPPAAMRAASFSLHALHSLILVAVGFVVAIATGVPLGLWMGWSRRAEAAINPVFLIIRPIPPLAWIPLASLWLGLGDAAKVIGDLVCRVQCASADQFIFRRPRDRPADHRGSAHAGHTAMAVGHRDSSASGCADDLYRITAVAAGGVDDSGRCRTGWRTGRARARPQHGPARYLSRHGSGRNARGRSARIRHNVATWQSGAQNACLEHCRKG